MRKVWPNGQSNTDPGYRSIPNAVEESIKTAFGRDTELCAKALECVQWDGINGCWCLYHAGMYIGIEESDGYMHT